MPNAVSDKAARVSLREMADIEEWLTVGVLMSRESPREAALFTLVLFRFLGFFAELFQAAEPLGGSGSRGRGRCGRIGRGGCDRRSNLRRQRHVDPKLGPADVVHDGLAVG